MRNLVPLLALLVIISGCSPKHEDFRLERLDAGFREGCCPMVFGDDIYYSVSDSTGMDFLVLNENQITGKGYSRIDMTTVRAFSDGSVMFVGYNTGNDGVIVSNNPKITDVGGEIRDFRDVVNEYSNTSQLLDRQFRDSKGCTIINSDGDDIVDYSRTWYVSCNRENKSKSYGFIYNDSIMWIGDKLAFTAENGLNDQFVVYDGNEIGNGIFKYIGHMVNYKGNLVFDADTKKEGPYHVYIVKSE